MTLQHPTAPKPIGVVLQTTKRHTPQDTTIKQTPRGKEFRPNTAMCVCVCGRACFSSFFSFFFGGLSQSAPDSTLSLSPTRASPLSLHPGYFSFRTLYVQVTSRSALSTAKPFRPANTQPNDYSSSSSSSSSLGPTCVCQHWSHLCMSTCHNVITVTAYHQHQTTPAAASSFAALSSKHQTAASSSSSSSSSVLVINVHPTSSHPYKQSSRNIPQELWEFCNFGAFHHQQNIF